MTLSPLSLRYCCLFIVIVQQPAVSAIAIPPAYRYIADHLGVKPSILYAVALTESGYTYQSRFLPWPWTLNIEGRGCRFSSRELAYQALKRAIAQRQTTDVGLMQVNWYWHGDKFDDAWASLDPKRNVRTGAAILLGHYQRTQDWWSAVEKYHAPGRDKASQQRAKRYRLRVFRIWQQLNKSENENRR